MSHRSTKQQNRYVSLITFSKIFSTHRVMSLKELTDGLPQAFLSLNSKDTLSCRLPSIFRATFQANSQKRESDEEERRSILKTLGLHEENALKYEENLGNGCSWKCS